MRPKKKVCAKCGIQPRRPTHRYCNGCHAGYMRRWRKTHPLTAEQKMKDNARSYAGVYLSRGKIERKPCEVEGCTRKAQMHHDDYTKPLELRWRCRWHHLRLHYEGY